MCETPPPRGIGWRGWMDLPEPVAGPPLGPWIDLSHPLSEAMPRAPVFPRPRFERLMCLPADPINVTEIQMVVHLGTHVDAPRHFFSDGPAFDEIPLARLHGPGVVWRLDLPADGLIEPGHFQAAQPALRPGDILALDTGWAARFGTEAYERHPSLSPAAAAWLVAQRVKLLAVDCATPDLAVIRRPPGFAWPVHHILLSQGVLVCEHLRGHAGLAGQRVEFLFNALNIAGADGAPARVLARPVAG